MSDGRADRAADHAVAFALAKQHRCDQCRAPTHLELGVLRRDALARHETAILLPVFAITLIVLGIDDSEILAGFQTQSIPLNPTLDDRGPADEQWTRDAFVHHDLCGTQHSFLF